MQRTPKPSRRAWLEVLRYVSCRSERCGRAGELVLELEAPPRVRGKIERERERLEELAAEAMKVPVRIAWAGG